MILHKSMMKEHLKERGKEGRKEGREMKMEIGRGMFATFTQRSRVRKTNIYTTLINS